AARSMVPDLRLGGGGPDAQGERADRDQARPDPTAPGIAAEAPTTTQHRGRPRPVGRGGQPEGSGGGWLSLEGPAAMLVRCAPVVWQTTLHCADGASLGRYRRALLRLHRK